MVTSNKLLGHYRILSKLGTGGMGEVFLAEDEKLQRPVALKVLPEDIAANKDRLFRFEREARAVSALNHPNILTIFESGTEYEDREFSLTLLKVDPRLDPSARRPAFSAVAQKSRFSAMRFFL